MAETDTGSQTPSPLGNDPGERGGEHGLRGGTRAGGAHPENPGVDRNTRYIETAEGILTGAEIEAVFVDALYRAFGKNREPVAADIGDAVARTVPLAQTMDGRINALRHWANGRAQPASATNPLTRDRPARRLDAN